MNNCYSSENLIGEIKQRIKIQYGNQEKFAKVFGGSRKTVSRLLNRSRDFDAILRMCKLLKIEGVVLVL